MLSSRKVFPQSLPSEGAVFAHQNLGAISYHTYTDLQTKREGNAEPHSQARLAAHGGATRVRPELVVRATVVRDCRETLSA